MKRKRQDLSSFGRWLVETAESMDLTLTAFADKARVSKGTLRYLVIEPTRRPTLETCLRLSAFTGKPMEELLALTGSTTENPVDPYHPDRLHLMSIFDNLTPDGRLALLTLAEAVRKALTPIIYS